MSEAHRLLRRARVFGPALFDPAVLSMSRRSPAATALLALADDGRARGIHFFCVNASIRSQFEFVQQTWCNNPRFGGLNDNKDPIIGDNNRTDRAVEPHDDTGTAAATPHGGVAALRDGEGWRLSVHAEHQGAALPVGVFAWAGPNQCPGFDHAPAKYRSARRPGRKKYAPPRTVTNCGSPDTRRRTPPSCRHDEVVGDRAARYRLAIAEQRIALARQAGELGAHHPGVLQELELARDVRVETDEVQSALGLVGGAGCSASSGDSPGRTRGRAAGCDESERTTSDRRGSPRGPRPSIATRLREAGRASGIVGVARIRAAHVRAERTARRPPDRCRR